MPVTLFAEYQKSSYYKERFDAAISIAKEKLGIEEVTKAPEESSDHSGNFEIKRKNLSSNSASNNCLHSENGTPPHSTEYSDQYMEHTSTPAIKCTTELLSTPTRPTRSGAIKQSAKRPRSDSRMKRVKKMKESCSEDDQSNDPLNNNSNVTPCNSSSDNDSEDDLPAISITQTPTKGGYSSCKLCFVEFT